MYFLYILQSEKDNSLYIGHSRDVYERLRRHNEGHSRSTKGKRPWKLIDPEYVQPSVNEIYYCVFV